MQPWDTVLRGRLSGTACSRPRKYHQTTPSAIPATNDLKLKNQNFEAGIPALKGKRVRFWGKENSLSSLIVYKDL